MVKQYYYLICGLFWLLTSEQLYSRTCKFAVRDLV